MVLERENLNCRRLRNVNLGEWLYLGCGIWKPRISVLNICIWSAGRYSKRGAQIIQLVVILVELVQETDHL
jgi:hypothetical protein